MELEKIWMLFDRFSVICGLKMISSRDFGEIDCKIKVNIVENDTRRNVRRI